MELVYHVTNKNVTSGFQIKISTTFLCKNMLSVIIFCAEIDQVRCRISFTMLRKKV